LAQNFWLISFELLWHGPAMNNKIQNLFTRLGGASCAARVAPALLALCALHSSLCTAEAQGTAFTYQGRLNSSGSPANGSYDFTFALFNNNGTNTGQVGGALTNLDVGVTNGLFTVTLDFGAVFAGNATWLAIGVRTNGDASFTALNPLQELTPAPYAIYASNAGSAASANSVAATNITGTIPAALLPAVVITNGETNLTLGSVIFNNSSFPFVQFTQSAQSYDQIGALGSIVLSDYVPFNGGSASGMTDLPIQNSEIAPLMPIPHIVLWGWGNPPYGGMSTNPQQSVYINWMNVCQTNGIVAGISNFVAASHQPNPLFIEVDSGWPAPHRITNAGVSTNLTWNTTNFPNGIPWLCATAHSNFFNVELAEYYFPRPLAGSGAGQGEMDLNWYGTSGSGYTYPAIQADTVTQDITNFYGWGVDKTRIQNVAWDAPYERQLINLFDNAILCPSLYSWNDPSNPINANGQVRPMAFGAILDQPPVDAVSGLNQWSLNQGAPYIPYCQSTNWNNNAEGFFWLLEWHYTNSVPLTSVGTHLDFWDYTIPTADADVLAFLSCCAILNGTLTLSPPVTAPYFSSRYINELTNSNFLGIWLDPLQSRPIRVFFDGTNSVYIKQMQLGRYAVLAVNKGATNITDTITWPELNLPSGSYYDVQSVWGGTDFGSLTGSFSDTITNGNCGLYLLTPAPTPPPGQTVVIPLNGSNAYFVNGVLTQLLPIASPVAWWTLNQNSGNAADASGNGYTGVLTNTGGSNPAWVVGDGGYNALSFAGYGAVNMPPIAQLGGAAQATLSAWMYRTSTNGILYIGTDNDNVGARFNIEFIGTTPYCEAEDGNPNYPHALLGGITTNVWNYFCMTFDGTQSIASNRVQFYWNGVLQGMVQEGAGNPAALRMTNAQGSFFLNQFGDSDNTILQDVRVFTNTLTQAQVSSYFNAGPQ
jgi:hypothetical protein